MGVCLVTLLAASPLRCCVDVIAGGPAETSFPSPLGSFLSCSAPFSSSLPPVWLWGEEQSGGGGGEEEVYEEELEGASEEEGEGQSVQA